MGRQCDLIRGNSSRRKVSLEDERIPRAPGRRPRKAKDGLMVSYNEVPYPSFAYSYTHPDTMATIARLMGLNPPAVETASVLELGSAAGGNIIPMAVALPRARFLGIDLSDRQISEGQAQIAALGLANIDLRAMDILDVTPETGSFDYIIVHGIYSWVPQPVREKILEICRQNLTPNGVAYISYNAFPGWHMLGAIRQMMLWHTRDVEDPQARASRARHLVDFLSESVPAEGNTPGSLFTAYSHFLKSELKRLKDNGDSYVLHDELEEVNQPFYFHEFSAAAASHGLEYLSEADFASVFPTHFPPSVREGLQELAGDVLEMEQYMDFLRLRTFRRTLLVHDGLLTKRSIKPEPVRSLYVASLAEPVAKEPDIKSITVEQFKGISEATLSTDHPASKAAMIVLARAWPKYIAFPDLLDQAYDVLDLPQSVRKERAAQDAQVLSANLLRSYSYSERLVELHTVPLHIVTAVSQYPLASPWARLQAESCDAVTNLRHERVEVDGLTRFVLRLLDGRHDRASLRAALARPLADGQLVMHRGEETVAPADAAAFLDQELDDTLAHIGRVALLMA
jgi:methyltransferase-like protein/SAM-dependent methyltransferase